MEKLLLEPYLYTSQLPGKGMRTIFSKICGQHYNISDELIQQVDNDVGCIHTASIMIDDLEDGSEVRRGEKTSHIVYGNGWTINSSFLALFQMLNR